MKHQDARNVQERAERMLDAAQALFLENGLRGTTMEAIARRAKVAKPTLYAYFPDKTAVFQAVIERVIGQLKEVADAQFQAGGTPVDRISRALGAKFAAVHRLLEGSPHARELMTDKVLYAGEEFEALERWLTGGIATILQETGLKDAEDRARILVACADGLHHAARDAESLQAQIDFVTRRLLSDAM